MTDTEPAQSQVAWASTDQAVMVAVEQQQGGATRVLLTVDDEDVGQVQVYLPRSWLRDVAQLRHAIATEERRSNGA